MASKSKRNMETNWATTNDINEIIFRGVTSIVEGQSGSVWTGTMTNLTTALNRVLSRKQRTLLPGSPGALRVVINRVVNRLRNRGIGVRFGRTTDHARTRYVKFTR
jgi:hypothetical protein